MAEVLKIKNRFLTSLVVWLVQQSLKGQYSRARTRFVNKCQVRIKEVSDFYQELLEKMALKEANNEFKKEKRNINGVMKEVFSFKDKKTEEEFIKEVDELYDEDFILEVSVENKKDLKIIRNIILDTDYKFGPKPDQTPKQTQQAIRIAKEYNEWCEVFENLNIK